MAENIVPRTGSTLQINHGVITMTVTPQMAQTLALACSLAWEHLNEPSDAARADMVDALGMALDAASQAAELQTRVTRQTLTEAMATINSLGGAAITYHRNAGEADNG
jgi:predicted trehalose synthase